MTENVDILVKNAILLTMDSKLHTYENGTIAIKDGKIVDLNKTSRIENKYTADKVIDGRGKIILPGFINTHDHLFQVLMKSLGDDLSLLYWWPTAVGPFAEFMKYEHMHYAALAGTIEQIKSGVTTTLDFQYANPFPHASEAVIDAWKKLKVRGVLARGFNDADLFNMGAGKLIEPADESLKDAEYLLKKYHRTENERINIAIAPSAPFVLTLEALYKSREFADKYNILISIHLHESKNEVKQWKEMFGKSEVQYYEEKVPEFLGPDVLGVHCVWMDEQDIKIMSKHNMKVSHNTMSNMYLASGVAPVPEFLKNGIAVSLGLDGAASNNNQDFMEMIKTTALLHKVARVDPQAITATDVLKMATIDGARSVLLEKEVGSLEVGKKADLIIFDTNNVQMRPLHNPPSQIVYCGKSWNIESVIIDGNIVMENRKVLGIDEQEILTKLQELADDLIEKADKVEWRRNLWINEE